MTRLAGIFLLPITMVIVSLSSTNAYSQSLDSDAQAAIATFGKGVIVPIAGDAKVGTASDYLGLKPGTMSYKVSSGNDEGKTVDRVVKKKEGATGAYLVSLGKYVTATLSAEKDGVFLTTEVDSDTSSISTFDPNEMILLSGLGKGEKKTRTIGVKVHDVKKPTVVTHTGSLECTYEVLGAFKVKASAGTFDTIGVRVKYKGSVGPASVEDSNYLFFAKGVGPVAMRFRSQISAFMIYNKNAKQSLLLTKK